MPRGFMGAVGTSAHVAAPQPSALSSEVPMLPALSALRHAAPHTLNPIPISAGCAGPGSTLLLTSTPAPDPSGVPTAPL